MRSRTLTVALAVLALLVAAPAGSALAAGHGGVRAQASHAKAHHSKARRRRCVRVRVRGHHGAHRTRTSCRTVHRRSHRKPHVRTHAHHVHPTMRTGSAAPRGSAPALACTGTTSRPAAANLAATRVATLCLLNSERAKAGLGALRENGLLERAATAHSAQMIALHVFDHTLPGTGTIVDRLLRIGYVNRSEAWQVGENIAWATGGMASPRAIVAAWMASPGHRANILTRAFRSIGIGVVPAVPVAGFGGQSGATYTTDFGSR